MNYNKVKIQILYCKINLNLQYYTNYIGKLKGIKKSHFDHTIYLIEFINGDRIWALRREFLFL